jgi:hypothetical protein
MMEKRGFRKLVLDSGTWLYKVGKGHIAIISPTGQKHLTDQSKVTGMSWDTLERGYWKKWFTGIGPGMLREWIENNILSVKEQ